MGGFRLRARVVRVGVLLLAQNTIEVDGVEITVMIMIYCNHTLVDRLMYRGHSIRVNGLDTDILMCPERR